MSLKDFFRSKKQPLNEPSGALWSLVRELSQRHVKEMIADFRRKGWPLMDWAEPRYRSLITPEALDWLIRESRHLLTENVGKGVCRSTSVYRTGSWFVTVSVFPSADDNEFVAACPGKSYEQLALQVRSSFREQLVDWQHLDFAHWLLLVDGSKPDAAINLHTTWNLEQCIRWLSARDQPIAPMIVPLDLIRSDPAALTERILKEDALCCSDQEDRKHRVFAGQLAKVLLMDSITAEVPLPVSNPLSVPAGSDSQFGNVLDEVCHRHAQDCQRLGTEIPLVFGVPQQHLGVCRQHLAAATYHGLKPENVLWVPEGECGLLGINEGRVVAHENASRFLAGGGNTFLLSNSSPIWSNLWNQGIRWLLFGQVWNLGCRVDAPSLKAIAACQKDGLIECTQRHFLQESKLILLNKGKDPPQLICVDDHRLRTKDLQNLRTSQTVGTGTFWVKLDRLVSELGLDPNQTLIRFDRNYLNQALEPLLRRDPIVVFHSAGGFASSLPLWEILSCLDLKAITVSPERFNPRIEP